MAVITLNVTGSRVPNLDCAILRTCHHPFTLAVKSKSSDIVGMALESQDGSRICRFNVVELHSMMSGSSKKALVWGNAQPVDL